MEQHEGCLIAVVRFIGKIVKLNAVGAGKGQGDKATLRQSGGAPGRFRPQAKPARSTAGWPAQPKSPAAPIQSTLE
ncbi:MAG: hypothetical protein R2873_00215 [Caldilineaceae bacterium]